MFLALLALSAALTLAQAAATPAQQPLVSPVELASHKKGRKLKGKFLQITDIHPDAFYKTYSSTDAGAACHREDGPAGLYGAETSDCDSPYTLINATFKWIEENLKNEIDFVIWTGDTARHDNDEDLPRDEDQVLGSNRLLVEKFREVFKEQHDDAPNSVFEIPIIPTFGNNDILPHNIFAKGPNKWTKSYAQIWRDIIPEEQRHGFDRGGWFYVEVIPNKLAVFSLNTLYFFDSNSAVDGCALHTEPGYEHMEWLRIQLEFLRQRGMKAIMSGHVPPARNDQKVGWDETCWQKYTIWMQQYRDVVVGAVYGHMNIEHFVLQDFQDIDYDMAAGSKPKRSVKHAEAVTREKNGQIDIAMSAPDYLISLRELWSKLPSMPSNTGSGKKEKGHKASKQRKLLDKIGGEYAQRFAVSQIAASVVPNYFPTLRVYEYNITGLEGIRVDSTVSSAPARWDEAADISNPGGRSWWPAPLNRPKTPRFTIPDPPSKRSPPGPAYSPQTLSWLGYTQYYSNLTDINNDFTSSNNPVAMSRPAANSHNHSKTTDDASTFRWNNGKHGGEVPEHQDPRPNNFTYEVEYNTADAKDAYGMSKGLTVREWVALAASIGRWEPKDLEAEEQSDSNDDRDSESESESDAESESDVDSDNDEISTSSRGQRIKNDKDSRRKKRKHDKKKEAKRRHKAEEVWYAFASRAIVGTMDREELKERFG